MDQAEHVVFTMLRHGVPLTLLIDLVTPGGPDSAAILATERELSCAS